MNTMNYQGYIARIEYDDRDNILVGRVLGLPDTVRISFHGETVAELREDFHRAIDFFIEESTQSGHPPIKPASGKCRQKPARN